MNTYDQQREDYASAFIAHLERLKQQENRGALAALRRSLIDPGSDFSAFPIIGPFLPSDVKPWEMERLVVVSGLYAMHQEHESSGKSLGASLRRLRSAITDQDHHSLDLVFSALLNADEEDLAIRLRHAVARLASKDILVDYAQLLRDVRAWSSSRRRVQRRWAHDYWVGSIDREADITPELAGDEVTVVHESE